MNFKLLTLALLGVTVSGLKLDTKAQMEAVSQDATPATPEPEPTELAEVEAEADAEVGHNPNAPADGVIYQIFNHDHPYDKMYSHGRNCGFWNGPNHDDQMWRLEQSRFPGYFFMENVGHRGCRLASHGSNAFTWCNHKADDQLWKFEAAGNGYYISNKVHGGQLYHNGRFGLYRGRKYNDQIMILRNIMQASSLWRDVRTISNTSNQPVPYNFALEDGFSSSVTNSLVTSLSVSTESSLESAFGSSSTTVTASIEHGYERVDSSHTTTTDTFDITVQPRSSVRIQQFVVNYTDANGRAFSLKTVRWRIQ